MHSFKKYEAGGNKNSIQAKANQGISLVDNRNKAVFQRMEKVTQLADDGEPDRSMRNLVSYGTNVLTEYGVATVRKALVDNGLRIRGHHSGGSGDGMNAATEQDIAALVVVLRAGAAEKDDSEVDEKKHVPKGGGGKRHSKEKEEEVASKKAQAKKDKKAAGKAFYIASQKRGGGGGGRGNGRGGGGGRGGAILVGGRGRGR